jgi:hypothetical protein
MGPAISAVCSSSTVALDATSMSPPGRWAVDVGGVGHDLLGVGIAAGDLRRRASGSSPDVVEHHPTPGGKPDWPG